MTTRADSRQIHLHKGIAATLYPKLWYLGDVGLGEAVATRTRFAVTLLR